MPRFDGRRLTCSRPGLLCAGVALVALGGVPSGRVWAQESMPLPQVWTGNMVVPEGVEPGLSGDRFELRIFQVSSDQEIQDLGRALASGGQGALRDAMFMLEAKGWIQIGRLVGTQISVIRVVDLPDGRRRVRLFSSHPLRLYDKSDPAGSADHPFAFLELAADASGRGTGFLVAAASLAAGEQGLQMESAGAPTIQLVDVTTDRPPAP